MFKEDLKIKREPFKFIYTRPSLDWYEDINVEIEWGEYDWFELQWRYGGTCWIVASKYDEETKEFNCEQIGELRGTSKIYDFIKWCEVPKGGSVLTKFTVIDGDINLFRKLYKVIKDREMRKAEYEQL